MYGFVSIYGLFILAMVIITIGEMIVAPGFAGLGGRFCPVEMRGRLHGRLRVLVDHPVRHWPVPWQGLILDGPSRSCCGYAAGVRRSALGTWLPWPAPHEN